MNLFPMVNRDPCLAKKWVAFVIDYILRFACWSIPMPDKLLGPFSSDTVLQSTHEPAGRRWLQTSVCNRSKIQGRNAKTPSIVSILTYSNSECIYIYHYIYICILWSAAPVLYVYAILCSSYNHISWYTWNVFVWLDFMYDIPNGRPSRLASPDHA